MNFRLTAALFAAIFLLGLVLLGLWYFDDKDAVSTDAIVEELALAAVKPEEVDRVEIERPGQPGKIVLARADKDKWELLEPVKAPADRFAVDGVVQALFRAKPTAHAELSTNLGVHDLEPPSLRIVLKKGDKSSTVNIGTVLPGGNKAVAFVSTSARPKRPIAVLRSGLDALFRDPSGSGKAGDMVKWTGDFRTRAVFSADSRSAADVGFVKVTSKDKTLELTKSGVGWSFVSPAGWGAADATGDPNPAATGFTGVTPLITALTSLSASSADDFLDNPGDLKQYGLEPGNPDAVRVELRVKDAPPEVVTIGKKVDATPATSGLPPAPSAKWFVQIQGVPGVVRATAGKLEGLAAAAADPNPLRDRTVVSLDKARIDAIDLAFGGQTLKLRKPAGAQWKLYGAGEPVAVNQKFVEDMLGVLTERRIIRDFPPANDANFAGNELKLEVKLWADGVEGETDPKADPKAEPKLKGNPLTLQVGKQEGDRYFTRRTLPGGAKTDFGVPEKITVAGVVHELIPTLRKDRLALLDTTLPGFSPFNATKLTITQGGAVTEIDKAEDPASPFAGKWTFAQPANRKGQTADSEAVQVELLSLLSRQAAVRFVSETPTEAELAGWGLDPKNPRMKIAVGLKPGEGDAARVYTLGNETGDGFVYARHEGRPAVFLLPVLVSTKFATTDVRDKTVVKFDRAKVKGVRVRGWKESSPAMVVLEFEKRGTEWASKTAGTTADGAKVNALLSVLDGLRAKSFVPGLPAPQHRFPPETESGFEVTIELDGAPAVSVNIGGETPEKGAYFGFSSQLPAGEQLFTVPADALRGFKASRASLSK